MSAPAPASPGAPAGGPDRSLGARWAWLWFKHRLVGTPLERLAGRLRWIAAGPRRLRHPELAGIEFEPLLIDQLLDRALGRDSCCLDVGTHIGSMLVAMKQRAPQGRHAAFEPSPRKCGWLARRFRDVSVHNVALGDAAGSVTFYEDRRRPGFSSLAPPEGADYDAYPVPLARLDDLVGPEQRVDFVKMDVEGAELGVLRGAEALLARERPVVLFESGPGSAERCGYTRRDVFDWFVERDYRVYLIAHYLFDREPLDWETFDRCHLYPFRAFNFVAAPLASGAGDAG